MFLVSHLARQTVTVSLSGDGGDELFGGYGRYFLAPRLWGKIRLLPRGLRKSVASAIAAAGSGASKFSHLQAEHGRKSGAAQKLAMLSEFVNVDDDDTLYTNLISLWQTSPVIESNLNGATKNFELGGLKNYTERMMLRDALSYLPDDILVKVDRASMGVSLEARVPILDYRIVEFAWRVPMRLKIRDGQGKFILRELLNKYVPQEITTRPKMGFDVPVAAWLRGELRDWAESLIDAARLKREGFLDVEAVGAKWKEHLSGKRNHQHSLWAVLMFQAWLDDNHSRNLLQNGDPLKVCTQTK